MRTLIFALCFAAVSNAATVITIPAWSSTLAGGEVLSLSGTTLTIPDLIPFGQGGTVALTAMVDASIGGTASYSVQHLTQNVLVNGNPVAVDLLNAWTLSGSAFSWAVGYNTSLLLSATSADGVVSRLVLSSFPVSVAGTIGSGASKSMTTVASVQTQTPEPATILLTAIGVGVVIIRRRITAN